MKSHRSRPVAAATALVLSATLAGCSQADPRAAARSGDTTVSEHDVQTATRELSGLQLQQPLSTDLVTQYLAFGPVIDQHLAGAGVQVGPDKAKTLLADPNTQLSQPSLQVLTTLSGLITLQEASQSLAGGQGSAQNQNTARAQKVVAAGEAALQDIQQRTQSGDIVVNPKYQKVPVNWVKQDAQQRQMPPAEGQQP